MSVVSDSPLLIVAAAGASTQTAPMAAGTSGAREGESFARVLQSERTGTGATQGASAARSGEKVPSDGNTLPVAATARAIAADKSASSDAAARGREGNGVLPQSFKPPANIFLLDADGAISGQAVKSGDLPVLPDDDAFALLAGDALSLPAEEFSTLAPLADADTPLPLPRIPTQNPAAGEPALQTPLVAQGALPGVGGDLPNPADGAEVETVVLTPGPLTAMGNRATRGAVPLPQGMEASPEGEARARNSAGTSDAIVFDPGASQRAVAALQDVDAGGRLERGAESLRQLLAGVSQDRAGSLQRLDQAMLAQASAPGSAGVEGAALAAALQRGGEELRQTLRTGDTSALIAGVGASSQAVNGPDQSSRPAPLFNLLATPSDPEFAPEFAGRLQMMVKNGVREANLQLHPAELGRLQLSISTEGDQARIVIVAESAAARDMIEQSMPRLREMLEQSGLQLAQGDVSQRQRDSGDSAGGGALSGSLPESGAEPGAADTLSVSAAPSDRLLDAYV